MVHTQDIQSMQEILMETVRYDELHQAVLQIVTFVNGKESLPVN